MKWTDPVAKAFREARVARGLSMRDVELASKRLWAADPIRYDLVSRSTISNIENEGSEFFTRPRDMTPGKAESILEILWNGDESAFVRDTGVTLRRVQVDQNAVLPITLPLYREGSTASPKEVRGGGRAQSYQEPALPGADLLVEVTTAKNSPVVYPGQVIGVKLSSAPLAGALNVLLVEGALTLAYQVREDPLFLYVNETGGAAGLFRLSSTDTVIGYVTWLQPRIPPVMPSLKRAAS